MSGHPIFLCHDTPFSRGMNDTAHQDRSKTSTKTTCVGLCGLIGQELSSPLIRPIAIHKILIGLDHVSWQSLLLPWKEGIHVVVWAMSVDGGRCRDDNTSPGMGRRFYSLCSRETVVNRSNIQKANNINNNKNTTDANLTVACVRQGIWLILQ